MSFDSFGFATAASTPDVAIHVSLALQTDMGHESGDGFLICPQISRIFADLLGCERGLEEKQTADDLVEYRILISVHECSLAVQPKLVDRISYRLVSFFNKFVE